MGSKKHKKHHRSDKKDSKEGVKLESQEKPLKLVLKVDRGANSLQTPGSPSIATDAPSTSKTDLSTQPSSVDIKPPIESLAHPKEEKIEATESHHSHDKHKKSKKKKKKKSSDRDRDKHQKRHKHHHHHHHHREHSHERKEKRRREHDHDQGVKEPPQKRQLVDTSILSDKPLRDQRSCTLKKKTTKTPLQMLLSYLLKCFQKKDPQHFFAWPVSDVIAPGYSSIISTPMDFSTMKQKTDAKEYSSIADFKHDLKLMCDNAMMYNRPDTIYYKAAKKMWHGQKLFNKEQLMSLSRNLPIILDMSPDELGFNPKEHIEDNSRLEDAAADNNSGLPSPEYAKKSKHKSKHIDERSCYSDDDDDLDEILVQAQRAAKGAADRLTFEKPNSNYAFLRQRDDGTTTLAVLNPDGRKSPDEVEVNLEMIVGKLSHGAGSIPGFKEDPKNIVRPVKSLNYGSFCSYAPQYDSMFSNLTKDESCLVLSTYGDELGVQYAESLMTFAKDCDYVMTMVDNMLDALTDGTHSKTIKQLEERRKVAKEDQAKKEAAAQAETSGEMNLSDLEMDFLNSTDEEEKPNTKSGLQQKLDETSGLLQDLAKVQNERLSSTPPSHLSNIQGAGSSEIELADKVTRSLTEIASQASPGAVVGVQSIRKAIGISYQPVSSPGQQSPSLDHESLDGAPKQTINRLDDISNDKSEGMECEFQEFLDTNSMLQTCDSSSL